MPSLDHCYSIQAGHPVNMVKYYTHVPHARVHALVNVLRMWSYMVLRYTHDYVIFARLAMHLGIGQRSRHIGKKVGNVEHYVILSKQKHRPAPYVKVISSNWDPKWHYMVEKILNIHSWCGNNDVFVVNGWVQIIHGSPMKKCSHTHPRWRASPAISNVKNSWKK